MKKELATLALLGGALLSTHSMAARVDLGSIGSCGVNNAGQAIFITNDAAVAVEDTVIIYYKLVYWTTWVVTVAPHSSLSLNLCTVSDGSPLSVSIASERSL